MEKETHPESKKKSIIQYSVKPKEKTPWHYHTLFSETFEIIEGSLTIGKGDNSKLFRAGEQVTIKPYEKHFFNNTSGADCLMSVTVYPFNQDFEDALSISRGLEKDGLTTQNGTPRRLNDLALFIYLNNSKMVGLAKIAEPFFSYLAKNAIKKGYLEFLKTKYVHS